MTLKNGQKVSYTFYGNPETATIERIANGIVWLDNGRWMHETSVTPTKAGRSKAAKAKKTLTKDQLFFYDNAGYSYNSAKGETAEQGRIRCAIDLAAAEQYATNLGWTVEWEYDYDIDDSWMSPEEQAREHAWLCARLMDGDKVLAALGGIVDADQNYKRVIEAELANEALVQYDKDTETIDAH